MDAPPSELFRTALEDLQKALSEFNKPWMIIGGLAVIANGHVRLTRDIDLSVLVDENSLDPLVKTLRNHRFEERMGNAVGFARERHVLLLRHPPTQIPLDLSFAILPFQVVALKRAKPIEAFGVSLKVATCGDLIVMKMVAMRARDLEDVEQLLLLHGKTLDHTAIRNQVKEFSSLLGMPEMLIAFEERWDRATKR